MDEQLYNTLKEKSNSFNDWLISKNNQIKDLNKEINDITNDIGILNGKIHKETLTLSKIEASIDVDKRVIEKEISSLENSKICPTCNREKDKNSIQVIKEKIENLNKEIENKSYENKYKPLIKNCNDIIFKIKEQIKDKELIIESKRVSIKDFEDEVNKESVSITKIKEKIAKIEIIIKEIEKRNKFKQEYDNIPTLIENIDLKVSQKNGILSKYEINITSIEENKKIQSKIDTYKGKVQ